MQIREVMTPDPKCVQPSDTIQAAAKVMRDQDTGAVPVVENGKLLGMITDRDIVIRSVAEGGDSSKAVKDIITRNVVCATPDMSTGDASDLMSEHQVRRLPVVDGDKLVGIVSIGDIAVKEGRDSRTGETLEQISEGVKH